MKLNRFLRNSIIAAAAAAFMVPSLGAAIRDIEIANPSVIPVNDKVRFSADIVLDSLRLGATRQVYITPIIEDGKGNSFVLPSALVNGRSMQIAWNRGTVKAAQQYTNGIEVVERRNNGHAQTISYNVSVPMQPWMWSSTTAVRWVADSCGCGHLSGSTVMEENLLSMNPADRMRVSYVVPKITDVPVSIHEGKANVNYEVNEFVLHTEPYICRNGQVIDNRVELQVIDDSVSNALANKNMEIAKIRICGYASPDGNYFTNERLSSERSRSLAEYLADRYHLPAENYEYSSVPENWEGFRQFVIEDSYLTPEQHDVLLGIIDRPVFSPSQYDDKESELRTDPVTSEVYRNVILPEWFPQLRTTKFEIRTRLKPLTDEQLAEVIKTDPDKMSLNQMFRVSSLYPEGSPEFNAVIDTMLEYFPHDEAANLNAASAAIKRGEIEKAEKYLVKAGDSPEAWNTRGIVATWQGNMDRAREFFRKAGALPEAAKNLEMLGSN